MNGGWLQRLWAGVLLGLPVSPVVGEEEAKPRLVRFLAVGEAPPFRQEIRDGVRHELPPPPGSVPPERVTVTALAGEEEKRAGEVQLRLGLMSQALEIDSGPGSLVLVRKDRDEPWLRLERPESGDLVVVLWRDASEGDWDKARSRVLTVDPDPGKLRIANVSPWTVALRLGGEKAALKSSGLMVRRLPAGRVAEFEAGLVGREGRVSWFHSIALEQQAGESSLVVLYRADRRNPRRPLKLFTQRQKVVAAAPR